MGHCTSEVDALRRRDGRALYLLTHHAHVPVEQDGIRDGEHIRNAMTDRFTEALTEEGLPHVVLDGPCVQDRVEQAVAAIDEVVSHGWQLGVPLEYR